MRMDGLVQAGPLPITLHNLLDSARGEWLEASSKQVSIARRGAQVTFEHQAEARREQEVSVFGTLAPIDVQEYGWLGHDKIGLEILPAKRRGIEVRKHQPIGRISQRRRIACLVLPSLKVHHNPGLEFEIGISKLFAMPLCHSVRDHKVARS